MKIARGWLTGNLVHQPERYKSHGVPCSTLWLQRTDVVIDPNIGDGSICAGQSHPGQDGFE